MIQFSKFFKPSTTVSDQPYSESPQRWCNFTLLREIYGGNREEFTWIAFHLQFKISAGAGLACVRRMEHFSTGWSPWQTWAHIFFHSLCLTTVTTKALAQPSDLTLSCSHSHRPSSCPLPYPTTFWAPQPIQYLSIDRDIKGLSLTEVISEISLSKN